ncbi:hypothetical protein F751_0582 [Auxenochlorella protothecoides]|uniref:Uncharacterized protein n=1 Tax=Auxenochlorella protothecoides TaxID=3075 RepID=A0A087SIK1_AUXPR|nr:hypothetical protein F751_0582 [Auxenochlorella protothecoides]KFM25555.1 hypothetical protein F751_0582 [Auxenochlorella protothecoides]
MPASLMPAKPRMVRCCRRGMPTTSLARKPSTQSLQETAARSDSRTRHRLARSGSAPSQAAPRSSPCGTPVRVRAVRRGREARSGPTSCSGASRERRRGRRRRASDARAAPSPGSKPQRPTDRFRMREKCDRVARPASWKWERVSSRRPSASGSSTAQSKRWRLRVETRHSMRSASSRPRLPRCGRHAGRAVSVREAVRGKAAGSRATSAPATGLRSRTAEETAARQARLTRRAAATSCRDLRLVTSCSIRTAGRMRIGSMVNCMSDVGCAKGGSVHGTLQPWTLDRGPSHGHLRSPAWAGCSGMSSRTHRGVGESTGYQGSIC